MIETITLLGSSSGRNAGDAALISGIMDSIDDQFGSRLLYEIPTIKPNFIWRNYQNRVRPVSMLPWHGSLKMLGIPTAASLLRTDLSMIFDAILFDRSLYNPLFNFLSTLWLMLPQAKKRGKKLGCFNVGTGPVDTPRGREMLREVCELMDFITVRDQDSADLLRDIGVKNTNLMVTADAALTLKAAPEWRVDEILSSAGLTPGAEMLAINVSSYLDSWSRPGAQSMGKEKFIKTYSEGLNKVIDQLGVPVVFVGTQHSDLPLTRAIMNNCSDKVKKVLLSNLEFSHYEIKGILSKMSLLYAMRLHAVILASSALTPVLALPHQPKVVHYLKTVNLERYAMNFDNFSGSEIANQILTAWGNRTEIRTTLRQTIPGQQKKSIIAAQLVHALHKGESVSQAVQRLTTTHSNNGTASNFSTAEVTSLLG